MHDPDFLGSMVAVLILAGILFWIWMLVDCLKHPAIQGKNKMTWFLIIVLFNVFGAAAYFAIAKPQPTNEA